MENVFGNIMRDGRNTLGSKGKKTSKVLFPWFFSFLVVPIDQRSLMTMVGKLFCEPWLKVSCRGPGVQAGHIPVCFPKGTLYSNFLMCTNQKHNSESLLFSPASFIICILFYTECYLFYKWLCPICLHIEFCQWLKPPWQMILAIVLWSSLICYFLRSQFCFQIGAHFKGLDC